MPYSPSVFSFHRATLCLLALLVSAPVAASAQTIIYPAKGQSSEQQQKDEGECMVWARNETGVDPTAVAGQTTTTRYATGGRVRGAAGGAALGAIGGAIGGNAGKGAAIGAAVGAVGGGVRQRRENRYREAQAAGQNQANQEDISLYNRAYHACLEGRGYTVK